jgi:hypothetical protein
MIDVVPHPINKLDPTERRQLLREPSRSAVNRGEKCHREASSYATTPPFACCAPYFILQVSLLPSPPGTGCSLVSGERSQHRMHSRRQAVALPSRPSSLLDPTKPRREAFAGFGGRRRRDRGRRARLSSTSSCITPATSKSASWRRSPLRTSHTSCPEPRRGSSNRNNHHRRRAERRPGCSCSGDGADHSPGLGRIYRVRAQPHDSVAREADQRRISRVGAASREQ